MSKNKYALTLLILVVSMNLSQALSPVWDKSIMSNKAHYVEMMEFYQDT